MLKDSKLPIIYWLFTGCFLIFLMVIIGGITRLTQSGLSIVEWNLIMGTLPPINADDWQLLFQKYQTSPQYQLINKGISLQEFKSIFWWEYIHRLFGRFIGLVFFVPFIYFWFKKKFDTLLFRNVLIIMALGGLQGVLGWYMVASGLVKNPYVSHYRLAAHLITAFSAFGFTFWVALTLLFPKAKPINNKSLISFKRIVYGLFIILIIQIIYGAFVAGMHAGKIYNTFPLMGDAILPESVYAMHPFWKNFLENLSGVQFIHRYTAYVVAILAGIIWFKSRKERLHPKVMSAINFMASIVVIQFLLGVFTLVYAVPVSLGVIHQAGAFILFGSVIYLVFWIKRI